MRRGAGGDDNLVIYFIWPNCGRKVSPTVGVTIKLQD